MTSPANGKGHQLTGTRCWLPAPFNLHGSIYNSPFYIQETFLHLQRIIYAQSHTFLTWVSKRWDSLPKANSGGRLNDARCVLEAAPRQRIRATTQGTPQLVVPKVPVLSCLKLTDLQASSPELQQGATSIWVTLVDTRPAMEKVVAVLLTYWEPETWHWDIAGLSNFGAINGFFSFPSPPTILEIVADWLSHAQQVESRTNGKHIHCHFWKQFTLLLFHKKCCRGSIHHYSKQISTCSCFFCVHDYFTFSFLPQGSWMILIQPV